MNHIKMFLICFTIFYCLYLFIRTKSKNFSNVLIFVIILAVIITIVNAIQVGGGGPWSGLNALLTAFLSAGFAIFIFVIYLINQSVIQHSSSNQERHQHTSKHTHFLPPKQYWNFFVFAFIFGLIVSIYTDAKHNDYLYAFEYSDLTIIEEKTDVTFRDMGYDYYYVSFKSKAKFYKEYLYGRVIHIDKDKVDYSIARDEPTLIQDYPVLYIKSGNEYLEAFLTQENARFKLFSLYALKYFAYIGIPLLVVAFVYFEYRKWRKNCAHTR